MAKYVIPGDVSRVYEVEGLGAGRYRVVGPDGASREVELYVPGPGRLHVLDGGRVLDASVQPLAMGGLEVLVGGERHRVAMLTERQVRLQRASGKDGRAGGPELKSPMAGKVVAVQCAPGESVKRGKVLVIVEAMKMENDLKAHIDGVVGEVRVVAGQTVEVGQVLLTIA
jgi:biotin carboxyl carrier protein